LILVRSIPTPSPGDCAVAAIHVGLRADDRMSLRWQHPTLNRGPQRAPKPCASTECEWKPGDRGTGPIWRGGTGREPGRKPAPSHRSPTGPAWKEMACGSKEGHQGWRGRRLCEPTTSPLSLHVHVPERCGVVQGALRKIFSKPEKIFLRRAKTARPGPLRTVPKTCLREGKGGHCKGHPTALGGSCASRWSAPAHGTEARKKCLTQTGPLMEAATVRERL
jgi:hypothetical protein